MRNLLLLFMATVLLGTVATSSKAGKVLQFMCENGQQISTNKICDGNQDCDDRSDEKGCLTMCTGILPSGEIRNRHLALCNDGECTRKDLFCNGHDNCKDRSDEAGCSLCTDNNLFNCGDAKQTCIHKGLKCDGFPNCPNRKDELHCGSKCQLFDCGIECMRYDMLCSNITNCKKKSFCDKCVNNMFYQCKDTKRCIHEYLKCDGIVHCNDHSDETGCKLQNFIQYLKIHFTQCDNMELVRKDLVCNGVENCQDKSDEKGCKNCEGDNLFKCDDNKCIRKNFRCDGVAHCKDRSDEKNCGDYYSRLVTCGSGEKTDIGLVCNNVKDCMDGSDEVGCDKCNGIDLFKCKKRNKYGGRQCFHKKIICDGQYQCQRDLSDERNCKKYCTGRGYTKCHDKKECIETYHFCDENNYCKDQSDEKNCGACNESYHFPCNDRSRCIHLKRTCDGNPDCDDESDEWLENCGSSTA